MPEGFKSTSACVHCSLFKIKSFRVVMLSWCAAEFWQEGSYWKKRLHIFVGRVIQGADFIKKKTAEMCFVVRPFR
jgi:hypothetical protein